MNIGGGRHGLIGVADGDKWTEGELLRSADDRRHEEMRRFHAMLRVGGINPCCAAQPISVLGRILLGYSTLAEDLQPYASLLHNCLLVSVVFLFSEHVQVFLHANYLLYAQAASLSAIAVARML